MNSLNTKENWLEELQFIQSIPASTPGPIFNNDPACFGRYCAMQVSRVTEAGYQDIADDILLHALGGIPCG